MRNGSKDCPKAEANATPIPDLLTKADIERTFKINRHVILRRQCLEKDDPNRLIPAEEPPQSTFPFRGPRFRYDDIAEIAAAIEKSKLDAQPHGTGIRYFSVLQGAKTFERPRSQLLGAVRHGRVSAIKRFRPGSALVERYEIPDKELCQYVAEPKRKAWRFDGVYEDGRMNLAAAAKTKEAMAAGVSLNGLRKAAGSRALRTEMRTRPDTNREEHVITPETLATFLKHPRRWSKRFNGIYSGTEPNRMMNANAAARNKGVKIHIIRQAPKDKLPYTKKARPGTKRYRERVYYEPHIDAYLNPSQWTPKAGRLSFEQIAAERKALSSRDRWALYLALKEIRDSHPDCFELSPGRGRPAWYDPLVLELLGGERQLDPEEGRSPEIQIAREAGRLQANSHSDPAQREQSRAGTQNESRPEPADRKKKRSTGRGEAQEKLRAALIAHHEYRDGSCGNWEPVGNNQLADLAGVANSAAVRFFSTQFHGRNKYVAYCLQQTNLIVALRLLNREVAPHILLYGRAPLGEQRIDED